MSYHKVKETDPPIALMPYASFYHQIIREHQFALAAVRTLQAQQHIYVDEMGTTHARPLGQHLLAEFRVNPACLQGQQLKDIIYQAAKVSGATILKSAAFDFHPISDASGIVVIEESHFIYHYLPEYQLLSFDAFTCGEINFRAAIQHMQTEVQATPYDTLAFKRGIRTVEGEHFVHGIASQEDAAKFMFFKKPMQSPLKPSQKEVGQHVIAEFNYCHKGRLNNADFVLAAFHDALIAGGGIVLRSQAREHSPLLSYVHEFKPQGVTAVVVGAGYHLTIHDWPEFGYAAIDLCSFNDKINLDVVMEHLIGEFQPQRVAMHTFPRGVYNVEAAELQPTLSNYLPQHNR